VPRVAPPNASLGLRSEQPGRARAPREPNPLTSGIPDVEGVTHRQVSVRGVRLHVAEAGDGPPLLLLHGWPQHWWCWRHLIPRLAQSHRVLAPDLRGFGWSAAPPGDYAKASFAADLLALLDAERIDRVRVVGHDWGGYTAFLLALEHPERLERLVALDVAPPWTQPSPPHPRLLALPLLASYQVLLATPLLGPRALRSGTRLVRTIIRAGSGPGAAWSDEELDAYAQVLCEPARAEASSACYRTFLIRELPTLLRRGDRSAELRVPALLALGAASALYRILRPRPGQNLRVETIPGAGHFLPEEAPEAVLRLTARWLSRRRRSA
jgi:pimeloyl-ACP methyl ester carboxylesterase